MRSCESPDILLFPSLLNKWPSYARHWTDLDYWSLILTPEPVRLTGKPLLQVFQTLREPVSVLSCFSRVQLFATLWTIARQAPLSMGFSWQEDWSGCHALPYRGSSWPRD